MEYVILIFMIVALVIAFIIEFVVHHKSFKKLHGENIKYKNKVALLETGNHLLKSTVRDFDKISKDLTIRNAILAKQNKELTSKLDETNKKLQFLSKTIKDMKNI